jgi:hypothetical protein
VIDRDPFVAEAKMINQKNLEKVDFSVGKKAEIMKMLRKGELGDVFLSHWCSCFYGDIFPDYQGTIYTDYVTITKNDGSVIETSDGGVFTKGIVMEPRIFEGMTLWVGGCGVFLLPRDDKVEFIEPWDYMSFCYVEEHDSDFPL